MLETQARHTLELEAEAAGLIQERAAAVILEGTARSQLNELKVAAGVE